MQMGLLWFDNDPQRALAVKVTDAARRYREKFGAAPNTCYVNQAEVDGPGLTVALDPAGKLPLHVVPTGNVLPHHFWVGVESS